jgi:hypothetical protein
MSLSALLRGCHKQLTVGIPDAEDRSPRFKSHECDIEEDGQPPVHFSSRFVSIHPSTWAGSPAQGMLDYIEENYGVNVTLTQRIDSLPLDRHRDLIYIDVLTSMEKVCRQIVYALHQNYYLTDEINELLQADDNPNEKFINHLIWLRTDPAPTPQNGTWVRSDNIEDMSLLAAYSQTVYFGGIQRIQHTSNFR